MVQTMEATVFRSEWPCATRNKLQTIPVPGLYPSHSAHCYYVVEGQAY